MFPSKVSQGRLNSRFEINHKHNMRPTSVGKNINHSFTWHHDRLTMDLDRAYSTSVNRSAREKTRPPQPAQLRVLLLRLSYFCYQYSLAYVLTFLLTSLLVCSLTDSLTDLFRCFLSYLFFIASCLRTRPTYLPT